MRVSGGARAKSTPPCINHHPHVSGRYEIAIQPSGARRARLGRSKTTFVHRVAPFLSVKRSYSHTAIKKGGDVTKPTFCAGCDTTLDNLPIWGSSFCIFVPPDSHVYRRKVRCEDPLDWPIFRKRASSIGAKGERRFLCFCVPAASCDGDRAAAGSPT